jgi:hypothetical protein
MCDVGSGDDSPSFDGGGGYVPAAGPGLSSDYNYSSPIAGIDPSSFSGAAPAAGDSGGSAVPGVVNSAFDINSIGSGGNTPFGFAGSGSSVAGSGSSIADMANAAVSSGTSNGLDFSSLFSGGSAGGGPGVLDPSVSAPTQPTSIGGVTSSNPLDAFALAPGGANNPAVQGAAGSVSPGGASAGALAGSAGVGGFDPTSLDAQAVNNSVNNPGTGSPTNITPSSSQSPTIDTLLGKPPAANSGSGGTSSGISSLLGNSPLTSIASIAGLGYNIYQGQKQTANQNALTAAAQQQAATGQQAFNAGAPIATANASTGQQITAQGQALQQYLTTGQLPPNYQAQVDQAINSYKQQAISAAVAKGQPGDPNMNSSLAQTLAGIDQQRATLTANLAQSLLGAGQNASGLSAQLYQTLVQNDTTQAANTGKAIASLAAALNSKGSNTGTTATS